MNDLSLPPRVTDAAFAQIEKIGGVDAVLRVAVDGGGCSGFQYRIELGKPEDDDLIIAKSALKVAIDPQSQPFLNGAIIDYTVELIGSRFTIENPNASSSCGCGTSFSI